MHRPSCVYAFVVCLLGAAGAAPAQTFTVTLDLPTQDPTAPPVGPTGITTLTDLNAQGVMVGNLLNGSGAFRLEAGLHQLTWLQCAGGEAVTEVTSVNSGGQMVGVCYQGNGASGVLLPSATGQPTVFRVPGGTDTYAFGINDLGTIVGAYRRADGWVEGFIKSGDTFWPIAAPFPDARETYLTAITDSEILAGYYRTSDFHYHGFWFYYGQAGLIDVPGAEVTMIQDLNDQGVYLAYYQRQSLGEIGTAVYQYPTGWSYLALPGPVAGVTVGQGLNPQGQAVGGLYRTTVNDPVHGYTVGFVTVPVPGLSIQSVALAQQRGERQRSAREADLAQAAGTDAAAGMPACPLLLVKGGRGLHGCE